MYPIIQVDSLAKQFKHHTALKNIDLAIYSGDIYGIIGMSGAGKTTLMRCLLGLDKPTSGSIQIENQEITSMNARTWRPFRQKIGMIFQHFNLFPSKTVEENIAFPMKLHGKTTEQISERVDELLELVGLPEKKNVYPSRLSGGEKQRVGIARALANHPDILFCDEPTSALDPQSTRSILALLEKLNHKLGLTLVIITHQLELVKQLCNKVAVLSNGEIAEQGLVTEVFSDPKHPVTRSLLHPLIEKLPADFLKNLSPEKRLVNLGFRGGKAKEPIISRLIREHNIEVNILLGGLDSFQKTIVGELVVEISGPMEEIEKALRFLKNNEIKCEVIQ